ncbi:hypothetical protein BJ912DRAFT_149337 [Pholiota molesta]|nr:hypothetical protein BJ912DRAFT_149337 [Pholiota molesta]
MSIFFYRTAPKQIGPIKGRRKTTLNPQYSFFPSFLLLLCLQTPGQAACSFILSPSYHINLYFRPFSSVSSFFKPLVTH